MPLIQHKNSVHRIVFFIVLSLTMVGCKITKNVHVGKQYLKKNEIVISGDESQYEGLSGVVRQQPNTLFAGFIKFRLRVYNMISAKRAEKAHNRKLDRWKRKNARKMAKKYPKRIAKATRINAKRIAKAKAKGEAFYKTKYATLKDSLPNRFKDTLAMPDRLRERWKYKFGEAPVELDTFLVSKTTEQMMAYLKAKGFYNAHVKDSVIVLKSFRKYNERQKRKFDTSKKVNKKLKYRGDKVKVQYAVVTGERDYIDSVVVVSESALARNVFVNKFIKKVDDKEGFNVYFNGALHHNKPLHIPFDAFLLDNYRYEVATYMQDEKLYGFTEQNVSFNIDSSDVNNHGPNKMILKINFSNRIIQEDQDSIRTVPFKEAKIVGVHFHILDTLYSPDYSSRLAALYPTQFDSLHATLATLDSLHFQLMMKDKKNKGQLVINPKRTSTFHYNGEMFVRPALIESQNYLEYENYYKGYYIDRSYDRMRQLELFSSVRMEVKETSPGSGKLEVHYYLVPAVRQSWSIKPKASTVNGLLGLSASASYSTINLKKTGSKLETSIGAGIERNPVIYTDGNQKLPYFNTIEIGPQLSLSIPGLYPFVKVEKLGKRQVPKTIITAGYNYQERQEFIRNVFSFTTQYKFAADKTQNYILAPLLSTIKVASIDIRDPNFEAKINSLGDEFLKNTYRNQFVWEDLKVGYEFNNAQKDEKNPRLNTSFNISYIGAGRISSLLAMIQPAQNSDGNKLLFGIPYAQFRKVDTKFVSSYKFSKKHSVGYLLSGSVGMPYKNSKVSMPFDYSVYGGGANDVRGWEARLLGPGTYLTYLDSEAVKTQVGDIKIQTSLEYRFGSGFINHAFFVDAGNIWTMKNDPKRPGSQFKFNSFYKQIALAAGYGLRLDFEFFILRVDMGVPIFHPGMPDGSKWIFQKQGAYTTAASQVYGQYYQNKLKEISKFAIAPFRPHFQIGIGLPF